MFGAIDIGSNTIKLMVGCRYDDGGVIKHFQKTLPVRLGAGTFETGILPDQGIRSGVDAVDELLQDAAIHGAKETKIFATSAVRSAQNGHAFTEAVKSKTGASVIVLSGEEEAEMIFRGVCTEKNLREKRIWVVDAGGGSVEFIIGQGGFIEKKISLEVGSVRLMSKFAPQLPAAEDAPRKMAEFLIDAFTAGLSGWNLEGTTAVATGGSAICVSHWYPQQSTEKISQEHLNQVVKDVLPMDLSELASDSRIPKGRGEVILAGAVTYQTALQFAGKNDFLVSHRNLRYGLIDALASGYFR